MLMGFIFDLCSRISLAGIISGDYFWIEFIGSVRGYFLTKNGSFSSKMSDCPCFIFQGCFRKSILLTSEVSMQVQPKRVSHNPPLGYRNTHAQSHMHINILEDYCNSIYYASGIWNTKHMPLAQKRAQDHT
jgi:hypothetical protein